MTWIKTTFNYPEKLIFLIIFTDKLLSINLNI